jgi:hypothetical protein
VPLERDPGKLLDLRAEAPAKAKKDHAFSDRLPKVPPGARFRAGSGQRKCMV